MGKITHLRYDAYGSPNIHPQKHIKKLGITYTHATPQSICDQWWFWNCENVPEKLPKYITPLTNYTTGELLKPRDQIGWGLSEKEAIDIESYYQKMIIGI